MRVLVTGGAGYIGSVVGAQLLAAGHDVVVVDDLSTGHADAVPAGAEFHQMSVAELDGQLGGWDVEAVVHFAAKSLVGESMQEPARVLAQQRDRDDRPARRDATHGVGRIVFSSLGRDLRRCDRAADPGERAGATDQPVRGDEARRRPGPARLRAGLRPGRGEPAVLQRGGRTTDRRGKFRRAPRHRDPPHPQRPRAAAGSGARVAAVRDGLPDAGRHLRTRLHPRRGPRRRAPAGTVAPRRRVRTR